MDACHIFDPCKAKSQIEYAFICGRTTISWRSVKQTLTTSSNNFEIIAIHETYRECI